MYQWTVKFSTVADSDDRNGCPRPLCSPARYESVDLTLTDFITNATPAKAAGTSSTRALRGGSPSTREGFCADSRGELTPYKALRGMD
jgi:hypothetical protein